MEIRKEYRYLETHEWVRTEGDLAYVGISAAACEKLGELVYIELPRKDSRVRRGDEICTVESVKAASPIFAPVSGTVVEVDASLEEAPEAIARDPYGRHILVIRMEDTAELETLLDARAYEASVQSGD